MRCAKNNTKREYLVKNLNLKLLKAKNDFYQTNLYQSLLLKKDAAFLSRQKFSKPKTNFELLDKNNFFAL